MAILEILVIVIENKGEDGQKALAPRIESEIYKRYNYANGPKVNHEIRITHGCVLRQHKGLRR